MLWSGSPLPHDVFLPVSRRGEIAQAGMSSLSVVEHLDVLLDVRYGFLPGTILSQVNQLRLECAEEAFHRRVIPAVPLAAHRRLHLELLHQFLIAA